MNEKIKKLIDKTRELEEELLEIIYEQQSRFSYEIAGKRVKFEKSIREAHKKLKTSWFYWFITISPRHLLSAPFIYGLIIPLLIFDVGVSSYQSFCFRLYRIDRVKRAEYFIYDHQHLGYLNVFEKLHCLYCSYAVGLINYAREIAARTEEYWCPIKHAHKVKEPHSRYFSFLDYGDAEGFQNKFDEARKVRGNI